MSWPTPTELLQAAYARKIVAKARVGDLALFVNGELAVTLPPGDAGVSYRKAWNGADAPPAGLKVFSNEGPGPTLTFSLVGLTWDEAETIANAVCEAFEIPEESR